MAAEDTSPNAFTEQGVAMLSAVLCSETAIQDSIHIVNAFVAIPVCWRQGPSVG